MKHNVKNLVDSLLNPVGFQIGHYSAAIDIVCILRKYCDTELIDQLVDVVLDKIYMGEWLTLAVNAARMGASKDKREQLLMMNTKCITGTIMSLKEILSLSKMGVDEKVLQMMEEYIASKEGHAFGGYENRLAAQLELRRMRLIPNLESIK